MCGMDELLGRYVDTGLFPGLSHCGPQRGRILMRLWQAGEVVRIEPAAREYPVTAMENESRIAFQQQHFHFFQMTAFSHQHHGGRWHWLQICHVVSA